MPASVHPVQPPSGMTRPRRPRRRDPSEGAVQTVEEAFQLLRTLPAAGFWQYYAGTVPFVLAVFYFWADMSRSSDAERDAVLGALGLALAYGWMKAWQGLFCRSLWERLHPSGCPLRLSRGRFLRQTAAQILLQSVALPVRLVSLPFVGWSYAFFQNASVLAYTQDFGRQALRRTLGQAARFAHQGWAQNHLVLLLVGVIGFFVWLNVVGTAALVPMALKVFFGVETVFTLNPEGSFMNTTFVFATLLLTFLVVDPLSKTIYTLRCFRSLSRSTGADLLSRLARAKARAALIAVAGSGLAWGQGWTQQPAAPAGGEPSAAASAETATVDEFRASIRETLRKKEYQWRYPRRSAAEAGEEDRNWLEAKLKELADSIESQTKRFGKWVDEWLRKLFEGERARSRSDKRTGEGLGESIGQVAKVALVAAVAGLLAWVLIAITRRLRRECAATPADEGAGMGIDWESETIVATQLPEDEWMRLAREQIARGEHRLAVRALFLASLAHLGDRGLLSVARFKSNRDYSRELQWRARTLPDLRDAFGENVTLFERVWYGLHEIGREAIDRFTANCERIAGQSGDASGPPRFPPPPTP